MVNVNIVELTLFDKKEKLKGILVIQNKDEENEHR